MMFGETGADNSNVAGGYVRAAVRLLDSDNQTRYAALIDSLDKNADQSARGSLAMTMAEAYFYFQAWRLIRETTRTGRTIAATVRAAPDPTRFMR